MIERLRPLELLEIVEDVRAMQRRGTWNPRTRARIGLALAALAGEERIGAREVYHLYGCDALMLGADQGPASEARTALEELATVLAQEDAARAKREAVAAAQARDAEELAKAEAWAVAKGAGVLVPLSLRIDGMHLIAARNRWMSAPGDGDAMLLRAKFAAAIEANRAGKLDEWIAGRSDVEVG